MTETSSQSLSGEVALRRDGPVLEVTLDRAEKLNAFNDALVEGLHHAVAVATSEGVRAVVFRGAGKGFSGGFDLGGLEDLSDGDLLLRFVRIEQLLQAVYHAPFATIALTHGPCYGAAAELVVACQWRIAAPDARFRMPGARFGVVLGTRRLASLVGEDAARRLVLRGKSFDAKDAHEAGLVTSIADQSEWPDMVQAHVNQAIALDPTTYANLSARQRSDTRDADLAALINSVTAQSIKGRIQSYLDSMSKR